MPTFQKTEVDLADGQLSVKTVKASGRNGSVAITVELPARINADHTVRVFARTRLDDVVIHPAA